MTADPFRPDVAPYVLDALSADERIAFEQHLRACDGCRVAVDEVAALPALLDLVPVEVIGRLGAGTDARFALDEPSLDGHVAPTDTLGGPDRPAADDVPRRLVDDLAGRRSPEPPERLLERLQAAASDDLRRRRRSRLLAAVAVSAAAAVAVVLAVLPGLPWTADRAPSERVELSAVVDSPMTAEVRLRSVDWGTRIDVDCHYRSTGTAGAYARPDAPVDHGTPAYGAAPAGNDYSLVVTDLDGRDEEVATWSARPGTRMSIPATTSVPRDQIAGIALRGAQGATLLRADLRDQPS